MMALGTYDPTPVTLLAWRRILKALMGSRNLENSKLVTHDIWGSYLVGD